MEKNKIDIVKLDAVLAVLALVILFIIDLMNLVSGDISFTNFIVLVLKKYILSAIVFLFLPLWITFRFKKKMKHRQGLILYLIHVIIAWILYMGIYSLLNKQIVLIGLIWPIIYYCIIINVFVERKDKDKPKTPER